MSKILLIFIIWLSNTILLNGQNDYELSDKNKTLNAKEYQAENDIRKNLSLGSKFLYRPESLKADLDSASFYFTKALRQSRQVMNTDLEYESLFYFAELYIENSKIDAGLKFYKRIIAYYKETGQMAQEAKVLTAMGSRIFYDVSRDKVGWNEITEIFSRASSLYKKLGQDLDFANTIKFIADIHLNEGKLELAIAELTEAVDLYKSLGSENLHFTYHLLSVAQRLNGNLDKSLYYALEAVKSVEVANGTTYFSLFYSLLADNYMELRQYENSIEYYKKSAYFSKDKNSSLYYTTHDLISKCYLKLNKKEKAFKTISDLYLNNPPKTPLTKAIFASSLGFYYRNNKKFDLAEKNYNIALEDYSKLKGDIFPKTLADAYLDIGTFYIEQGNYNKAEKILRKTFEFPDGVLGISSLRDVNLLLFKVDSSQAKYPSAIKYYQKYKLLDDSIFNEKKSKRIEELQVIYESAKHKKSIDELQSLSSLQLTKLDSMGNSILIIIGVIVLLSIIIVLLIKSYTAKQKSNRLLISQKGEIFQKNTTLNKLLLEKEMLLKEVHHRIKNNLQIVMSLLSTQSYHLKDDSARDAIQKSQHRIYSMSLIHKKLYQTENVISLDMELYCKELVEYFKSTFDFGQRIQFVLDIDPIKLDSSQAVPIGLILNEAITNSIKHAFTNADTGIITIKFKHLFENLLQLHIKDNGGGILEKTEEAYFQSLGMKLIKGFSNDLDAKLIIENDSGLNIKIEFLHNENTQEAIVNGN